MIKDMKTLVMFEAFGGKLRSEPELIDLDSSGLSFFVPYRKQFVDSSPEVLKNKMMVSSPMGTAKFVYSREIRVSNVAHPVKVFSLVED